VNKIVTVLFAMSIIKRIKPPFWDHYDAAAGFQQPFNFRRKWILIVVLTSIVALTPMIVMTLIDFRLSRRAIETEIRMNTSRMVSNAWRTVSFFLSQRVSALRFVAQDNTYDALKRPERLKSLLENLDARIGGFKDIGLVDATGEMQAYSGPQLPDGINLCDDACFREVVAKGEYIKDVTDNPHAPSQIIIAIKHNLPKGTFFVLRAALDIQILHKLLSQLEIGAEDDAFIINEKGILQTSSRFHGRIYDQVSLPIPKSSSGSTVVEATNNTGAPILTGYAYIPDTPFILMIIKPKSEVTALWFKPRLQLVGFLILGIALVLLAILGKATYLVNRIHAADKKRVDALHQLEYTNKLASIGRLASGVAHEINNPLAIISQKAGLIKDLFTLKREYVSDAKIIGLIDSVLSSVERTGSITQRLLDFARNMDTRVEEIDLDELINSVLAFLEKEAARRCIEIEVSIPTTIPRIESDRGKLQQIFLNLFNNAFAAMKDGGRLAIVSELKAGETLSIIVSDSGHGIPHEDLKRIFEPFFSTRSGQSGTGLGLSVTYGLVEEIGGNIAVESRMGEGTRFIITLPVKIQKHESPHS
jgi:signal transduction histidine kinase